MRKLAVLMLLLSACASEPELPTSRAAPGTISGSTRVIDGDTLVVDGVKVRLNGIDAPERGQPYFNAATGALNRIVAGQTVTCRPNGDRSYDRIIASCYVGQTDIAAAVIASGAALDCARYSGGRYRRYETADARQRIRPAGYC